MLRLLRYLLTLMLLPALLAGALLLFANSGAGQGLLAWGLGELSGGRVVLSGLSGTLPWGPRVERLELHDGDGPWLVAEGVYLDQALRPLLEGTVAIEDLSARSLVLRRLPSNDPQAAGPMRLPVRVVVQRLFIADLGLDELVSGAPRLTIEGSGDLAGAADGWATLSIRVPGREDRYHLEVTTEAGHDRLALSVEESPGGLVAALAGLAGVQVPAGLGGWTLEGRAEGPRSALTLTASLEADLVAEPGARLATEPGRGQLHVTAVGLLDLETGSTPGLHLTADLPALTLTAPGSPAMASRRLGVVADLTGPLRAPQGQVTLELDAPSTAGVTLDRLTATVTGDATRLRLAADLAGLRAPGRLPEAMAAAPVAVTGGLTLDDPVRPFQLKIAHPLLDLAAEGGLTARLAQATLTLPDLGALAPGWTGGLQARGPVTWDPATPGLVADISLDAAHPQAGRGRVGGRLEARLAGPNGSLAVTGDWAGQPVALDLRAARSTGGDLSLSFGDSRWASVRASGSLHLASGATLPQGTVRFSAERLGDLDPLVAPWLGSGPGLAGRLRADLTLTETGPALIEAEGQGLKIPGALEVGTLALSARVTEPLGSATTQATLRLGGFALGQVGGDLALSAQGQAQALDLTADGGLRTPIGPLDLSARARLDGPARRLALQELKAKAQGQALSLLGPAVLDFAEGLAVDRLRLGLRPEVRQKQRADQGPAGNRASLEIAGRVLPRLDLTGALADLPLDLVRRVAPDLPLANALTGTLGADLRLTGTLDAPLGRLAAQASGLRLTQGPGRAVPPAQVKANLDLSRDGAQVEARAETGTRGRLHLAGRISGGPPFAAGALALRADGRMDLGLLDPWLTSGGRQLSGEARLQTAIAGTLAAPRLDGTLGLSDAALRDRTLGLTLTGIEGTLILAGDTLRLGRLTGQSGPGTVELTGTLGVLAPGLPVDLRLVARDARPIQLDALDLRGDADLSLSGQATGRLTATGMVRLSRLEVRLPDRLPARVATLQVRERGGTGRPAGPVAPAWSPDLALDLILSAPRAVYVSGRGVDAELGGEVQVRGTLAEPVIGGGFDLFQGQYELAGQVLRFTRGRIGFDGAHGIDPTLDLEARASAAGGTAILAVLGTAGQPRIELRGEPPLPQDEVLSRLLFGVAGGRLSPLQATRLGLAATSLAGLNQGESGGLLGLGIIDRLRTGLGLERLSLGSDDQGEATVKGERQLTDRIYVGARQGDRAGEPQGVLRIGITPRIKIEADIGAAGGTRAGAAFEREY